MVRDVFAVEGDMPRQTGGRAGETTNFGLKWLAVKPWRGILLVEQY